MSKRLVIMIDPGHGGTDPGAVAVNTREADINLEVARRLAVILEDQGFEVQVTRWQDAVVSLSERVRKEHSSLPDLFLSLHCNASSNPSARGIEIWTAPGDSPADPAATAIFKSLSEAFPERKLRIDFTDGDPDKEARFHVLVKTRGPAVLLEMGFLSNPEERQWLLDRNVQTHMALAIAAGITDWQRSLEADHARIAEIRSNHGAGHA